MAEIQIDRHCSLRDPRVQAVLDRLHRAARWDQLRFVRLVPKVASGLLRRKTFPEAVPPEAMGCYIPVSRDRDASSI